MAIKKVAGKRVVLLDTHAIIHRAYHALPEFSSQKGEPTGALYGLSAMLIKIIQDLDPDYIVACYDLPAPTHRHEVYEEYKAARPKMDDELAQQINRSRDVLAAFGIPIYEAEGFEADDVLGTIVAYLHGKKEVEVIIASGDMDTLQLVDDERVRVYTLRKGISDTILYDEKAVRERFGFAPELMPDYKGLRGDPSDNIPGVKGVGEKTATDLIVTFGSIENVYSALKKNTIQFEEKGFKPRVVKLLTEDEEMARFSKMIATIRTDAPIHFGLPKKTWREAIEARGVLALFDELGFRSLKDRFSKLLGVEQEKKKEQVPRKGGDVRAVREAGIALWLLNSDRTNPTEDDILRFSDTDDFEKARERIFKELRKTGKLKDVFETIERPLIEVVDGMEQKGIALDVAYLQKLSKEYHKELDKISERIYKHAGHEFNINSPKQMGGVLYDELGLKTERQKRTETGQRSTRESELDKMSDQHPIIKDILAHRELQKLLSTYIDNLSSMVGEDGRLHAQFLQTGTTTGRMASQNPNMQNIPIRTEYGKKIRNAFVAEKGRTLVAFDYSQIELRIAAALSGDAKLCDIFKNGGDVHASVAAEVFGVPREHVDYEMRRRAKIINFGIIYGMGVNALKAALGEDTTRSDAQQFLNDYFKNFPELAHYIEHTKAQAAHKGFTETLFGRRRYFEGFNSNLPYVRAQAERMAINAPIQGTSADIIKLAMVDIHQVLKGENKMNDIALVLQVHDELVYDVADQRVQDAVSIIKKHMEHVVKPEHLHGVPLIVDVSVGNNWGEMEKQK